MMRAALKSSSKISAKPSAKDLRDGLNSYVETRNAKLDSFIENDLEFWDCVRLQRTYLLKDSLLNLINTLWAVPAVTLRKAFELLEKIGWEPAHRLLLRVPVAFKTDFQKEIEERLLRDLFGLSKNAKSKLTQCLTSVSGSGENDELVKLTGEAEADVREQIADYCTKQNGLNDLAVSGIMLVVAQMFFGDRSLDVFGLGKRFANLWAKDQAASHFFLGKSIGKAFYEIAPPPHATSHQVVMTTAIVLLILALMSTVAGVLSFAAQKKFGLRKKQLEKLLTSVEDKLLLKFAKQANWHQ